MLENNFVILKNVIDFAISQSDFLILQTHFLILKIHFLILKNHFLILQIRFLKSIEFKVFDITIAIIFNNKN